MWFGPDDGSGIVSIGPVRIEKWRKQPLRTLLFGAKGDEKAEVRPGLFAALAVSKGMPAAHSNASMFCAGVRFTEATRRGPWCCPCDVRVTLGDRRELSRTVRWILTPDSSEMFFPLLPLSDAEGLMNGGALKVKADLLFHHYLVKEPCPGCFEGCAPELALRALMYGWCLAGSACLLKARPGAWEVFREQDTRSTVRDMEPEPWRLRPGLLTTARRWPVATGHVQELVPGLLIGTVEPASWAEQPLGVMHCVELREVQGEAQQRLYELKDGQLSGGAVSDRCTDELLVDGVLLLGDPELITHRAVEIISRCFELTFLQAKRYVGQHWDVAISTHETAEVAAEADLLLSAVKSFERQGRNEGFASWFGAGRSPSLAEVRSWNQPGADLPGYVWQPAVPGAVLRVHDTGWGAIPEIFKSFLYREVAKGSSEQLPRELLGSLVTLNFAKSLPKDEILAVPHSFQLGDVEWHLVVLVCSNAAGSATAMHEGLESLPRRQRIAYLHSNTQEWLLDTHLFQLQRRPLKPQPNSWLCTRDLTPELVLYMQGPPKNSLPCPRREGILGAVQEPQALHIRIVTEKALQQTKGSCHGGSDVPCATILRLNARASLEDLQKQVQESLHIPAARQLLLQLPDVTPPGFGCWLLPVRSPLSSLNSHALLRGTGMMPTVLLMFLNDLEPEKVTSMLRWPEGELPLMPLLCKSFVPQTMGYKLLGVLLVDPHDRLQQHLPWLQKRGVSGALACSQELGPGQEPLIRSSDWFQPIRMDVPLNEQSVTFGSAMNFEPANYAPVWPAHPGGAHERPLRALGCVIFKGELRASAWKFFQKAVKAELLDAKTCRYEEGRSIMFFELTTALRESQALDLCQRFESDATCERALCKGKLARHRPEQLYLLQGARHGSTAAQCHVWYAFAPGVELPEPDQLPLDFLAALDFWSVPRYGELRLLRAGRRSVWRPRGTAEVVWEEAPSGGDVWIRIRGRRRWADETDSEEEKAVRSREASESRPGSGSPSCGHESPLLRPSDPKGSQLSLAFLADEAKKEEKKEAEERQGLVVRRGPARDCPQLRRGICLEGLACRHVHPGAMPARPESCPYGAELRERCPLRNLCAFSHGAGEQKRPPMIRARLASGSLPSFSSLPETRGRCVVPFDARDCSSTVVRRSLQVALDEVLALMAQAKALSLMDELRTVERRLRRQESRAMSRASSYDSFFEGDALKVVLASPDNTQPSTPRSQTPTWPTRVPEAHWVEALSLADAMEERSEEQANSAMVLQRTRRLSKEDVWAEVRQKRAQGLGLMWHSSPFAISRTPNIHTPASHRSPARSPTSFSGYCSPIPGLSGVASPNRRRSGYSSPSTGVAATSSGLMRRLMSLREARGEEEDSDRSENHDASEEDQEAPDLLELLLKHVERRLREPKLLTLDVSSEVTICPKPLLPCHSVPFLNALIQTLLASPLASVLPQVSMRPERPAYSCFMQLFMEPGLGRAVDAGLMLEPLLRRFEHSKAVQEAPAFPGPSKVPGLTDMFSCFLHFLLGQLHLECKWPTSERSEDSVLMRIFGGLMSRESQPFLLLHLDLTQSGRTSVADAIGELLARYGARFLRLPPFLLLHLERFRTGTDGLPDRVSRKCRMDLKLELEEATNYTLRTVSYQLRAAMCHYGEVPEGGAYKALLNDGDWHVLEDATVRSRGLEDMQEIIEAEGHHVCFLMYRRLDTKTVNLRPHATT